MVYAVTRPLLDSGNIASLPSQSSEPDASSKSPTTATGSGSYVDYSPTAIADAYWQIHAQPRSAWTLEQDLRPYAEHF